MKFSPTSLLCFSHFFSAWGDRMWMFAIGLYLIQLTPTSLQLAAVYGLVRTITVVLFGPVVGEWVDSNGRIKVVRISLALQNLLVIGAALVIVVIIFVDLNRTWTLFCQGTIITLAAMANLASKATHISIERDWVVVITKGDKDVLAGTNAKLRRIDLCCAILAPVAVGFIMTGISRFGGIVFICAWNIISVIAEYRLLAIVYNRVPHLAEKGPSSLVEQNTNEVDENGKQNENETDNCDNGSKPSPQTAGFNFLKRCNAFFAGWPLYFKQTIAFAGLSLAFLYLTVLGFSAITTAYAYTQKLSEAVVSICYGVGSFAGIIGTFLFPKVRKWVGLPATGLVSFFLQLSMLSLCVIAIWLPGSPSPLYDGQYVEKLCSTTSNTTLLPISTVSTINSDTLNSSVVNFNLTVPRRVVNATQEPCGAEFSYWSISMLMTGLILSRAGLWMSDLTITQLIQENVKANERGLVSGTQNAFESILDLGQFATTIILHRPSDFGYLSLMSFTAIGIGYIVYVIFYFRFKRLKSIPVDDNDENHDLSPVEAVA